MYPLLQKRFDLLQGHYKRQGLQNHFPDALQFRRNNNGKMQTNLRNKLKMLHCPFNCERFSNSMSLLSFWHVNIQRIYNIITSYPSSSCQPICIHAWKTLPDVSLNTPNESVSVTTNNILLRYAPVLNISVFNVKASRCLNRWLIWSACKISMWISTRP